jgi:hypothetical protein
LQLRFDNFKRLAEAGALPQHELDWLVATASQLAATVTSLAPHVVKRPCEWWAAGVRTQQRQLRKLFHDHEQPRQEACGEASPSCRWQLL